MEKSIYSSHQQQLCELLKQIRLGAALQQEDLAQRLNKPQSFVSRYESGQRRLDILELRQICAVVGISLTEFVDRLERALDDA